MRFVYPAEDGNLTFIDRQVQGLLDALEEKGLLEETVVIYSADHGSMLGDHGNIHQGLLYERSARVPFVVHCPAQFRPGRLQAVTSHVDLMPTILSLACIDIPAAVEGRDLTPLFTREQKKIKDDLFIEISHNYGIVTDRLKMFVFANGEGELYDLKADPNELENRYGDPDYGQAHADLQQRLVEFQPVVASRFEKGPPKRCKEESEYHSRQGDVQDQGKRPFPPRQAGRAVQVRAVLSPADGQLDGAFFVSEERFRDWIVNDPQNGYALYIRDGKAAMGVGVWGNDTVIQGARNLPDEEVTVEGQLAKDGTMTLRVDGETSASGKAPACLPVRQARQDCLVPSVHVGVGHEWGWPIGGYRQNQDFRGMIKEVVLTLAWIVMTVIRHILRMPPTLLVCVGMFTTAAGFVVSAEREAFVVRFGEAGVASLKGADDPLAAEYIAEQRTLGHVRVRYRMGRNELREFSTADLPNQRRKLRNDPRDPTLQLAVIYNESGWTDYFADLEATERFRVERNSLYWSVHLRNATHKPIEIDSIYLPLPFDWRAERRTIVGGDQSYPYWTPPGGEGPFLVMTPVASCPLFEPTTSERDFTPAEIERLDEEGLYILPVWQGSMGRLRRRNVVLSPRFSRNGRITYAFRFRWVQTLDEVRAIVEEISREAGRKQESEDE